MNGIWLVYRRHVDEEKGEQPILMGRFAIVAGNLTVLEDRDGIIADMFPPGPVTGDEIRRIKSMQNGNSTYWEVVPESELQEGQRADLIPEMELGGEPWPQPEH